MRWSKRGKKIWSSGATILHFSADSSPRYRCCVHDNRIKAMFSNILPDRCLSYIVFQTYIFPHILVFHYCYWDVRIQDPGKWVLGDPILFILVKCFRQTKNSSISGYNLVYPEYYFSLLNPFTEYQPAISACHMYFSPKRLHRLKRIIIL